MKRILPLLMLAVALLTGCDPRGAQPDARASRLYANALDDLQAGRTEAAITGFEQVTLTEPKLYAAHFQLAMLLEDTRKDHIGAIAHYRMYCALAPKSDKAKIAKDRMRLCEDTLVEEYASRTDAVKKFEADKKNLEETRDELMKKLAKSEAARQDLERKVESLAKEVEGQRKMIAKFAESEARGDARNVRAEALAALKDLRSEDAAARARRVRPSEADLLAEAAADRATDLSEAKRLNAALKADEARDRTRKTLAGADAIGQAAGTNKVARAPFFGSGGKKESETPRIGRPKTYVVQEGDTLFGLAMRFYGKKSMWRAIREKNKAIVPPDGRLRRGQELRLP